MIATITPTKAQIIYNTSKKTIQELKAELCCDYIVNAGFFISDKKRSDYFDPTMWLVLGGKVISSDQYRDWGLVIEDGLPRMSTDRGGDFLSLVPIIRDGNLLERGLTADVARKSARTCIGWTKDGRLILAVVTEPMVRNELQAYMLRNGAVHALMCDGGGSAQGIFPYEKVASSRKVPTLLAVWAKEEEEKQPWEKVVELARSQIGVTESPKNSNNVKYNTWYYGHAVSGDDYKWCVVFDQWVFCYAGYTLPVKTASCKSLLAWYKANRPECIVSSPLPGDISLYTFGHCGIVTENNGSTIKAVEGNTSSSIIGSQDNGGGVYERSRSKSKVLAYIRPYKEVNKVTVTLEVLRKGSRGDQVKTLQQLLNANGCDCGKPDGVFGSGTEAALKKYQKAKKLGADGVCGQATWNAILGA